jgi:dihydrofolate reductase
VIISAVAAVGDNGVIGRGGRLPWRYPEDLWRFKKLTSGHAVIMGRRTFESLPRPLPDRPNLVLTRDPNLRLPEGVLQFTSLEAALQACRESGEREVFIIGGAQIYAQALPLCDRLYLTQVHQNFEGDTHFPPWDPSQWKQVSREDKGELSFVTYERARSAAEA